MCSPSTARRSTTSSTASPPGSASTAASPASSTASSRLRRDLGIPHTLDGIGVDDARFAEMAAMAIVDPTAGGNPRPLAEADALDLYQRAYDGRLG